ncbi:Swt1 family HEPN domain-containing protein [Luedemannella flava]|uniref:Swt1 family HEPN domain-containing protein n=1 Tax=Luedemannella flava TaxID=349316 RepID=A0ABN2MRA7_9ACTN
MATSNRDRIGQMFDLLSPALDSFIAAMVASDLPTGVPWSTLVKGRDEIKGIGGKDYDTRDVQVQLRMLTENITGQIKPGWQPFRGQLSRVHESYAQELRDARDRWAHMKSFTDDDAYRILDTAERLLTAIGNALAADQVAKVRLNLRRVTADKDDRRTLRSAAAVPASAGLKPWREVLQPHEDVATGNFQAAEFAADLYKVAEGAASTDYTDAVRFFVRTYVTEGLQDLIDRAVRRLAGDDNASPVINLQTNFGGGKTHSMLSLWHLASGRPRGDFPQELQELLGRCGYDNIRGPVHRVALVGNHFAPSGETKPDGTRVNTLWGELAWQLGGKTAYAMVADSDARATAPGGALHDLLAAYAPAVILIDEWVAYARQLYDKDTHAGGTFDTQFTFAQALTEVAKGTSGVLLAISIPASHNPDQTPVAGVAEEVGGEYGLKALQRLQNVVRRVAHQWHPASSDEAYHIVRRRLFVTPDAEALAGIGATARAFIEFYRKHPDDFPREARDNDYETRIRHTYPVHPELFDRLYEDWSSLERFQRTRGVLRLMNTVIHALWVGEDTAPLIMPGSIPLASATVNSELTQYLQDSWKAIIDADVDGPNSEPVKIDNARPVFGQRSLTRRLARTVFFGAAPTIGTAHKGIEAQRLFLGVAVPGDVPGNFHASLTQLADKTTYFYTGAGKYWYDLQANISRRAKDQAERLHPEDVWAEIVERLKGQAKTRGSFAGVHVCPDDTADIPDTDEARLIILHPKATYQRKDQSNTAMTFAHTATEHRGTANRTYRNMVVYLAADADRMAELDTAVREYLGWSDVIDKQDELDLTQNQKNQAAEKRRQADQTVGSRLLGTYHWALVPEQPKPDQPFTIRAVKAEGQAAALADRVSQRLGNDGALTTQQAPATIRYALDHVVPTMWANGHVQVGDLWKVYASYPYMPRLRDRVVLNAGLTAAVLVWHSDGFALADGYDETSHRYRGLLLPNDHVGTAITDSTLVVQPDIAQRQHDQEVVSEVPEHGTTLPPAGHPPGPTPPSSGPPARTNDKTRYFATKQLSADRYGTDFKKIADEIIAHLAAVSDVHLAVRIEIEATTPTGFDPNRVRTISENATTLKFEQSSFEEA